MTLKVELALLSCAVLGLRHGFDYDHLAAISDITSVQRGWREGMRLGFLYALGHACTIALLGVAVVTFRLALPAHLDSVGERIVGATLLVLTAYILVTFFRRKPGHAHPVSRIAILITGARYLGWHLKRLRRPETPRPDSFSFRYSQSSVFTIGILHGLGAETPSQLVLFLVAANLGGTVLGLTGLLCFIFGLLLMNTLMTASASGIFASSAHRPRIQAAVTLLTAAYSLIIGVIFLFGASNQLPALAP